MDVIIKNSQNDFNRTEQLYKKDVVAKSEYEKSLLELNKIKNDRTNLIKQTELAWQKEYTQLSQTNQNIHSNQKQLQEEENNYIITSPIDVSWLICKDFTKEALLPQGIWWLKFLPTRILLWKPMLILLI